VAGRCSLRAAVARAPAREGGAGEGGGEAGGCGVSAAGQRGAHGRRARRAPLAGPAPGPHAALFLAAVAASSPSRCPPAPGALSLRAAPRDSQPPALCFAALGALSAPLRPASLLHLLPSRAPLLCRSSRWPGDLPQPRRQIRLYFSSIVFLVCLHSHLSVWLCLPHLVA
jgi:hypothetical protein